MKKIFLRIILPLGLTAAILFFFLRKTPPAEIITAFKSLGFKALAVFICLAMLATLLRTWRYSILLDGRITFGTLFLITLVRNFSVDLLPARSAALIFYSYFTKKHGIRLEEGASSFVISLFYDTLALGCLLGGLLFYVSGNLNSKLLLTATLLIFLVSAAVIFLSQPILKLAASWRLARKSAKLHSLLLAVSAYLQKRNKSGERWLVFTLSLIIRSIKYLSLFLLFQRLVPVEFSLKAFADFTFGLAATELSTLIPVQGLAGIGTWEAVFSLVFTHIAAPMDNPFLVGLVIHLTTQAWEYLIGLAAFLYLAIDRRSKTTE